MVKRGHKDGALIHAVFIRRVRDPRDFSVFLFMHIEKRPFEVTVRWIFASHKESPSRELSQSAP